MSKIQMRQLGGSNVQVPAIGTGTLAWGFKTLGYGKSYSKEDLRKTYLAALDAGDNFFDTSDDYGGGESEKLIGEFHAQDGRPIKVATKFTPLTRNSPYFSKNTPKTLIETLDTSLRRMRIDQVDLLHIHLPPARHKLDGYLDALAETVKSGKARSVGVSNFSVDMMRYSFDRLSRQNVHLASNEVGYNLLRRYAETNGILKACKELDVALIAYLPLAEGILAGDFRNGHKVSELGMYRWLFHFGEIDLFHDIDDPRSVLSRLFSPRYLQWKKIEPLLQTMEDIAKAHDASIAQVCLNWLLAQDQHVIVIPGAKADWQVQDNIAAMSWSLSPAEFDRIAKAEVNTR